MKVAIFEDEVHNSERLIQLLKKCDYPIEVVAVIDSVAEGIKWMEQHNTADLMLMDIQLSDGNCFEIFKQANVKTPIIFTTAYDNFALQAFKVNSIDYLMKPIELKELKNALTKYQQFKPVERQTIDICLYCRGISQKGKYPLYRTAQQPTHLCESKRYRLPTIHQRRYLCYHQHQSKTTTGLFPRPGGEATDRHLFFRINDAIRKILTYYNSRLILQLHPDAGTDVIISRERVADFRSWLEGHHTN